MKVTKLFLICNYNVGKEDMEINYKIVKEPFKLPINIPISKSCTNLLKGMLEKNPQLRIELNNPIVEDWLNDNTKILYKRKKPVTEKDKDKVKDSEKDLDNFEEDKNVITLNSMDKKDNDNDVDLINNYFKPNSKSNTSNLEQLTTAESDEDVLREPAKFENSEEDSSSSFKFNNQRSAQNNNSLKNKLEQLNLNIRPAKKNTTITSRGNLSLGGSNGLNGVKVKSSPKKSSTKLEKESPIKKNFK